MSNSAWIRIEADREILLFVYYPNTDFRINGRISSEYLIYYVIIYQMSCSPIIDLHGTRKREGFDINYISGSESRLITGNWNNYRLLYENMYLFKSKKQQFWKQFPFSCFSTRCSIVRINTIVKDNLRTRNKATRFRLRIEMIDLLYIGEQQKKGGQIFISTRYHERTIKMLLLWL